MISLLVEQANGYVAMTSGVTRVVSGSWDEIA